VLGMPGKRFKENLFLKVLKYIRKDPELEIDISS
jgi:hypothetical protein